MGTEYESHEIEDLLFERYWEDVLWRKYGNQMDWMKGVDDE